MNSKYKRLLGDMVLFAIGSLGSKLVLFLLLPIYTNVLTDSEYGIADLVFSSSELVLPIISIAIYNGLLRYGLIEGKRESSLLISTFFFFVGSGLTILFTPAFALYRPVAEWKWFLSISVIVSFARANALVYLKVKNNNKMYSILSIAQALLLVIFNILLLIVFDWGIRGYLLSTIASNGLVAVIAIHLGNVRNDLRKSVYDRKLMKEMAIYSISFMINDVSWWIIHSSDKMMIEWMIGSSLLGIYTAASKIPSLINAVTVIFSQAWGLASAKEFDTTNDNSFYTTVFRFFSDVIFGVVIFIVSIIRPFMNVYVGNDFKESWHYVPLLLVAATFAAISTFTIGLYSASKKSQTIMYTSIVAGIINIIINYFLIQVIGIWGAVVGTVVAYFVIAVLRIIGAKKVISIHFDYYKLMVLSIICIVQATLVGLDIYGLCVSSGSICLFFIIIRKDIKPLIGFVKKMINRN